MKASWSSIALLCAALVAGCAGSGSRAPRAGAMPAQPAAMNAAEFLPGLWQAQITGNQYQMQVIWNPSVGQFQGTLAAQGAGSKHVGFTIGELVWTATPTADPNRLSERQMVRYANIFGPTGASKWLQGTVDLSRSSGNELVTSFARFRRIGN